MPPVLWGCHPSSIGARIACAGVQVRDRGASSGEIVVREAPLRDAGFDRVVDAPGAAGFGPALRVLVAADADAKAITFGVEIDRTQRRLGVFRALVAAGAAKRSHVELVAGSGRIGPADAR